MSTSTVGQDTHAVLPGENGWPAQGQWRYANYLQLPDDGCSSVLKINPHLVQNFSRVPLT